jgi:(1->4)-alpha-D-glucan 1-alpha-D-glucosylmutase
MRKALSESKARTNWANPDEPWLKACDQFIERILDRKASPLFWEDFVPFAQNIAEQGMKLSLVQVALKITSPGVPDFYQGTELWDFSLVDPDNRRPVDYAVRQKLLAGLDHATVSEMVSSWKDGRIKMQVIRSLLQYRREQPDLFSCGSYTPLKVTGPQAERFVAFSREQEGRQFTVIALRRMDKEGVADLKEICEGMTVSLPRPNWRDVLTDRDIASDSGELPLSAIFDEIPVAVLAA